MRHALSAPAILPAACLLVFSAANGQDLCQQYNDSGVRALSEGDIPKSEKLFLAATEQARKLHRESACMATSSSNLAGVYWSAEKKEQAVSLYEKALAIWKGTPPRDQEGNTDFWSLFGALTRVGDYYRQKGDYAKAEPYYLWLLAEEEKEMGSRSPKLIDSLVDLVKFYRDWGRTTEAEKIEARAKTLRASQAQGKARAVESGASASGNEDSAVNSLRALNMAIVDYQDRYKNGAPASLSILGLPSAGEPSCNAAGLIENDLASGRKGGYLFRLNAASLTKKSVQSCPPEVKDYTLEARPLKYGETGIRSFFTDSSGVIRSTREDRPATQKDKPWPQ